MADDADMGGEDIGWWNCSLCTYKNSADKFKCEICDLRRGTSTRKPRSSADTIVAQVVKQQEQIRQQTRAKPSPKSKTGTASATSLGTPTQLTATASHSDPVVAKTKKSSVPKVPAATASNEGKRPSSTLNSGSPDEHQMETEGSVSKVNQNRAPTIKKGCCAGKRVHVPFSKSGHSHKSSSSSKKPKDSKDNLSAHGNHNREDYHESDETDSDNTSVVSEALSQTLSPKMDRSASESSLDNSSQYSSSPAMTPEPTTSSPNHSTSLDSKQLLDHPFKIRPIEINGNLIKYSPPTSSGRTGLIIDKKRFTQHSVTVNDVTITFTEFATRQNKYIRKKKKRTGKAALPTQASTNATNATSATVAE